MGSSAYAQAYITLIDSDKTELEEHNLWHQPHPQRSDKDLSFVELRQMYQGAHQVASTFGGRGAYVSKIKIINGNDDFHTWFVNINAVYLDIGTAYWQSDKGHVVALERFGQLESTSPRLAHSQAFSLPLNHNESGTLWIYMQAKMFATPAVINFYSKTAFYRNQFLINSITSISFTVMMSLALIALFIYLRTQYLVTLACAGYIGIQGLGWFLASGSLGHLLGVTQFNPVYGGIMLFPLAIASASQFTKLLFNCEKNHPRLTKTFNLLSIISLALGIIMPFLPFNVSFIISHIIATIWIPLCIGTGIFMLANNDFRAKYYLIGNSLYSLTLMGFVLSHMYGIYWSVSLEVIVQISLTIDCVCILLSLSEWLQIQKKEFHRSYVISRIDPLTHIGNRFSQNECLANLTGEYCIAFIDLDGLKEINDQMGHDEGDKVLIATADIIQKKLHKLGSLFRCGGDEFIIVSVIERLQHSQKQLLTLSSLLLSAEKELQKMGWENTGFSFGIATSLETLNQSECLSLADQRMYKNKQNKKQSKMQ